MRTLQIITIRVEIQQKITLKKNWKKKIYSKDRFILIRIQITAANAVKYWSSMMRPLILLLWKACWMKLAYIKLTARITEEKLFQKLNKMFRILYAMHYQWKQWLKRPKGINQVLIPRILAIQDIKWFFWTTTCLKWLELRLRQKSENGSLKVLYTLKLRLFLSQGMR